MIEIYRSNLQTRLVQLLKNVGFSQKYIDYLFFLAITGLNGSCLSFDGDFVESVL